MTPHTYMHTLEDWNIFALAQTYYRTRVYWYHGPVCYEQVVRG